MSPPDRSEIDDEAAIWVARMDGDSWSETQEAELQAWLSLDPRHKGALLAAEAAWISVEPRDPAEGADFEPQAIPAWYRRRAFLGAAGAALAASFAGGLAWIGRPTTYTTDLGEIRRVPLGDGSLAAINTASKVKVKLADARRDVTLEQGEAWFQVAKDPKRPFLVEAGRVRVQAVGTAFSVRRADQGAEILVTEGVVEAWADGADGNRIRLGAGQRAFIAANAAIRREANEPSAVDRALAWRNGKIDLFGKSLNDAVAEFNRYNQRQLVLLDPKLGGEQLAGVFGTDDPEGFAITVKDLLEVPVDLSRDDQIRIGRNKS